MTRDPLSREQVRELQRERLLEAMVAVVDERGLREATVAPTIAHQHALRVTMNSLTENVYH